MGKDEFTEADVRRWRGLVAEERAKLFFRLPARRPRRGTPVRTMTQERTEIEGELDDLLVDSFDDPYNKSRDLRARALVKHQEKSRRARENT